MSSDGTLYPSDLTDSQWDFIQSHLPCARGGGRPRTTNLRQILNAIFYLVRNGCTWRALPKSYPPWQTVYDYFRSFQTQGVWKRIHEFLVQTIRVELNREKLPSLLIIDGQTVKAAQGEQRGYDGFKRLRGRKRQILVDSLGLIHSIRIHSANLQERSQGSLLFQSLSPEQLRRLTAIYADQGYRGPFEERIYYSIGIRPTIPPLDPESGQGRKKTSSEKLQNRRLKPITKKRWVVERTFGWFNHYRRLSKDYEKKITQSETMIQLAMTQLMLRRRAKCGSH